MREYVQAAVTSKRMDGQRRRPRGPGVDAAIRRSRATTRPRSNTQVLVAVRRRAAGGAVARRRTGRLRRARPRRRSTSRQADRSPMSGTIARPVGRGSRHAVSREWAHGRGSTRYTVERGTLKRSATSSPPALPSTSATRHVATTRPLTCCTPRCARCSGHTSSRPVHWSRPIGCASTSSTSAL